MRSASAEQATNECSSVDEITDKAGRLYADLLAEGFTPGSVNVIPLRTPYSEHLLVWLSAPAPAAFHFPEAFEGASLIVEKRPGVFTQN